MAQTGHELQIGVGLGIVGNRQGRVAGPCGTGRRREKGVHVDGAQERCGTAVADPALLEIPPALTERVHDATGDGLCRGRVPHAGSVMEQVDGRQVAFSVVAHPGRPWCGAARTFRALAVAVARAGLYRPSLGGFGLVILGIITVVRSMVLLLASSASRSVEGPSVPERAVALGVWRRRVRGGGRAAGRHSGRAGARRLVPM